MVLLKYTPDNPCCHGNENLGILTQISHNSANITHRAMNIAPNRGFSRSGNLPVSLEFTSDRPRLPWQRKFGNFNEKLAKTRLIQEIEPQKLHQLEVFEVRQFNGVIEIYIRPTPVAMATKIWEF